jgi:hypothetical protein
MEVFMKNMFGKTVGFVVLMSAAGVYAGGDSVVTSVTKPVFENIKKHPYLMACCAACFFAGFIKSFYFSGTVQKKPVISSAGGYMGAVLPGLTTVYRDGIPYLVKKSA